MGRRPGYAHDYYLAHKAKIIARKREWQRRNIERARANNAAWAAANPDKVRAAQKRYRDAHRLERRAKDAARKRAKRAADPEKARELYRQHNKRFSARAGTRRTRHTCGSTTLRCCWSRPGSTRCLACIIAKATQRRWFCLESRTGRVTAAAYRIGRSRANAS